MTVPDPHPDNEDPAMSAPDVLIIDAHLDLAWNALQWNRDIRQSAYTIRTREATVAGRGRARGTVALPELRQGRVALCFATTMGRVTGRPVAHVDFDSAAQAYGITQGQIAYYRALARSGHLRIITDAAALRDHFQTWQRWQITPHSTPPPLGIIISMESADPVLQPGDVGAWVRDGVRIIGPAHQGSGRYAGGTGVEDGLTQAGRDLLHEMAAQGVALDVTHLSDRAFWEALDCYDGPVLASHSNCRALVPHQRQISNEQIRALAERDAIIGVAFDAWMLSPGWVKDHSRNDGITLHTVADHIDHICQLTGSSHHAGIGTDLDGGFGRDQSPADVETVADVQRLARILADRGYTASDVNAIMHGNWLRFLLSTLPQSCAERGA